MRFLLQSFSFVFLCWLSMTFSSTNKTSEAEEEREKRVLSVFNVVTFPNSACGASNSYNGTCYTASECTSKGGTASGTCASSFGVCCVFSLASGDTTSENNTYAINTGYSVSSDPDPIVYTFCPTNTLVCKIRFDFDTMVLEGPFEYVVPVDSDNGPKTGDCIYDTLTITNPGGPTPPVICGYNTGQHIFVPASPSCNTLNIDIDTGTTTTTRKWQIKTTQYTCDNEMAPQQDCLQYYTATSGTVASFNWDTSASTVSTTQTHLSSQQYSICFRRARGSCSVCFSPEISPDPQVTGTATSYGVSAGSDGDVQKSATEGTCTGLTTGTGPPSGIGVGDYLEIANLQPSIGTTGTLGATRICGALFNANPTASIAHATACSWSTPFKISVKFDEGEDIWPVAKAIKGALAAAENDPAATSGAGFGYSGFYLAYWQNNC